MLYIAFLLFINIVNAIVCDVSQIHISQGLTPSSMTISWITKDDCYSHVAYGINSEILDEYMYGYSTSYNFTYVLNKPDFYQIFHLL